MKRPVVLILTLGGLALLACIVGAGLFYWRQQKLPICTFSQHLSAGGQYMATDLTCGQTVYVSDVSEWPLEPVSTTWARQIGKTADGMRIDEIRKQPEHAYVSFTGFMFPIVVFRRADVAPVTLTNLHVKEIQLTVNRGFGPKIESTEDPAIIQSMRETLLGTEAPIALTGDYQTYRVWLVSDQLPGLVYIVNVAVDANQTMYVAEGPAPEQWLRAGGAFARWVEGDLHER